MVMGSICVFVGRVLLHVYFIIGLYSHSFLVLLAGKYDVSSSLTMVYLALWPFLTSAGMYFIRRYWGQSAGSVAVLDALKAEDMYVLFVIFLDGW